MRTLIIIFLVLFSFSENWRLFTIFNYASKHCIIYNMDNNTQWEQHKMRGTAKKDEKKRNYRLVKLLTNQGFSFNAENDTIVICLQNPEFGNEPLEMYALTSLCEIQSKGKNLITRDILSPAITDSLKHTLIELNESAFRELYNSFAAHSLELPPKRISRIVIHGGRVSESSLWLYSMEPSIIVLSAIRSGDSVDQLIGLIKEYEWKVLNL